MKPYIIDRKIKRAAIIRPGCPLTEWYKKQTDKPDVLCNASLYSKDDDGNLIPIGSIIENGKTIKDSGIGRGLGIKDGALGISSLSNDRKTWAAWDYFLTGFNCYVQSGKAVLPTWRDKYVFENDLTRIAIGKINDMWCVVTGSGTLAEGWNGKAYSTAGTFTNQCIEHGITEIVGLDGSGSRALNWLGEWIYTSVRTPYNAIAIWLDDSEIEPKEEMMKVKCSEKTQTFTAAGIPESGRHIDKGDVCTLSNILLKTMLLQITYPVPGGTRTAYIRDIGNFTLA